MFVHVLCCYLKYCVFSGTSAKIAVIFRKPKEQEKKVKGGEEKEIEIGVGTGTEIETRG